MLMKLIPEILALKFNFRVIVNAVVLLPMHRLLHHQRGSRCWWWWWRQQTSCRGQRCREVHRPEFVQKIQVIRRDIRRNARIVRCRRSGRCIAARRVE